MSHDYPLYLCTAGVLIVPDYNISCVLSSIDCALQMLQVLFLGGMLKKGLKTGGTFSMQLLHSQFLTRYFQLRLSVHAIQKASCFLI